MVITEMGNLNVARFVLYLRRGAGRKGSIVEKKKR
jgi:hypothetical protein